jgi:membrane fusion protein, multidrug efflux system
MDINRESADFPNGHPLAADNDHYLAEREHALVEEAEQIRLRRAALSGERALNRDPALNAPDEPSIDDDGGDGHGDADDDEAPPLRRRIGIRQIAIGAVIALALAIGGTRLGNYLGSYETTDDATIDGHVIAVSSRVSGTILRVYVENTQHVKAGDPIADIDPRDATIAVAQARANLTQAKAQAAQAASDYQSGLANLAESRATAFKAERDAARYRTLLAQRVVARAEYEEYMRTAAVDAAAVNSSAAAADSAAKKIVAQQAQVQAAQAALDQSLLNLSYTHIVAPMDGVVGKKTVEAGQHVDPGEELLAIVPLDDIWVTADFKETQLRRMHAGQPVTVHVDALGRDYAGVVRGLGGASGELYSVLPPENATGNFVKVVQRFPVRIDFVPGQNADHRLRPGMSVEPRVELR